ncbi:unnamed protein product [Caenorhabditis sp. 36 PRJEB53466]|nr:unnamed protein product [Caenorhabditis sp. 36 PRJEB53466]
MACPEDYADFRVLARCPSGSKKNSTSYDSTNGIMRYRLTLGEVLSWNIDIDVIVGNGWTRITLKEIPRFIVDAFDFIMADGLQLDGIFRKEGNSARLNRPEVQEVYRGVRGIPSDFTVLDVCTMIKRFLKDLKPTLLNSDDVRHKLIEKAKKARLSGEFHLSHQEICRLFETPSRQLSPSHLGTLGYVMRLLSRIAKHSDSHKMTTDNLAVVLVGSVFGDFMAGGGTESRKKMQQARKCTEAELHAKKEDMGVQVAAVKLLIINANLIALPKSHYVSSNRLHSSPHSNIRSTSAMPDIRCAIVSEKGRALPFDMPSPYSGGHVFSMAKASLNYKQRSLTRRDSDLTHVKNVKRTEAATTKRSSSFLPIASLRGLRDKVSNQFLKRNKSPSPDKLRRQAFPPPESSSAYSQFSTPASPIIVPIRRIASGNDDESDDGSPVFRSGTDQRAGDCVLQKKGSTSSGRKSRAHTKKGNINSVMTRGSRCDSDSQKSFRMSPMEKRKSCSSSTNSTTTSRSLRRFSQSEQNSFTRNSVGDATPPLEKKKKGGGGGASGVVRRNTADGLKCRRNTGNIPSRRSTFWGVDSIAEEKENRKSVIIEKQSEEEGDQRSMMENGESVLEMMNNQARLRRVGVAERRHRQAKSGPSDSMMVLNGSLATFEKLPPHDNKEKASLPMHQETVQNVNENEAHPNVFATPAREKERFSLREPYSISKPAPTSKMGMQLEKDMRHRLDVVATPMMGRRTASESVPGRLPPPSRTSPPTTTAPMQIPLRKLDSVGIQQNGRVWVGKTQTVVSTPIPLETKEPERVSPILARSPVFRSPSTVLSSGKPLSPLSPFNFRSKSHLTEDRLYSQNYAALVTPPRVRRLQRSPQRPKSNLIYYTPKTRRQCAESPLLIDEALSRPITRSTSSVMVSPRHSSHRQTPILSPLVQQKRNSMNDEVVFKCPFLPPMKSHEPKEQQPQTKYVKSRESSMTTPADFSEFGLGEYNDFLRNSTEDTNLPLPHQMVEARPSVTTLRSSQCGLVQSRINHFQDIERSHRVSSDLSSSGGGRHSAVSQTSLKSIETLSSGGEGRA